MTGQRQIIINISPTGKTEIDAQCFVGSECADATKDIELVLGGGAVKKDKKPEFFAPAQSGQQGTKLTF